MSTESWRELIALAMVRCGDTSIVVSNTLSEDEMDVQFSSDYGSVNGKPFTLWTEQRVYFPVEYDGAEWVESVSRNPDGKPTRHVGG